MAPTPERPEGVEASSVSADERIRRAFVAVDASVARRRQGEAVVANALEAARDVRAPAVLADGRHSFGALVDVKTIATCSINSLQFTVRFHDPFLSFYITQSSLLLKPTNNV